MLPYSHPPKYSDRRLPPIRPTDRRIPTDLGNLSNSNSPRVRFNLKPIHFPVEIDDFPATRFRERSPSDPLVSFGSFLTDQRRVRFRSSSIESNDNVLLTIDDERQEARTSSGLGFEAGVGLGLFKIFYSAQNYIRNHFVQLSSIGPCKKIEPSAFWGFWLIQCGPSVEPGSNRLGPRPVPVSLTPRVDWAGYFGLNNLPMHWIYFPQT